MAIDNTNAKNDAQAINYYSTKLSGLTDKDKFTYLFTYYLNVSQLTMIGLKTTNPAMNMFSS